MADQIDQYHRGDARVGVCECVRKGVGTNGSQEESLDHHQEGACKTSCSRFKMSFCLHIMEVYTQETM